MLPDFPIVRKYASDLLRNWFQKRVSQRTGILQQIKTRPLHEGNKIELNRLDGSVESVVMKAIGSKVQLGLDDYKQKGLKAVLEVLDKTAVDLAQKQSRFFFNRLDDIFDEAGQSLDAKGRPLSFDLIIELFDKIDIDFDEMGNPVWPTLVTSPKMQATIQQLEISNDQKERLNRLIEEKRAAWRDRESNRRLVN